ncbi:SMI1/KNR4 family protein [Pseudomonas sp. JUb52]|uniref:SMI1/KNR4 family protein n=1 Tax=Pseudomonas sp. JUb52 TaxID=2485127 RepID=UPI00104FF720|nr:SMI1/KNR4 family protein [Pseudomonas sp. JUb52]
MKQLWQQLENHLSTHNPELLADLNPPATDAQIRELENTLGMQLPADFVACLKIHDGQKGAADWLFNGREFMSSKKIMKRWAICKDLLDEGDFEEAEAKAHPYVKDVWWSVKWVPFTYNGSGDHLCVDMEPRSGGTQGQIIEVWHDYASRNVISDSFSQWFASYVHGLEN